MSLDSWGPAGSAPVPMLPPVQAVENHDFWCWNLLRMPHSKDLYASKLPKPTVRTQMPQCQADILATSAADLFVLQSFLHRFFVKFLCFFSLPPPQHTVTSTLRKFETFKFPSRSLTEVKDLNRMPGCFWKSFGIQLCQRLNPWIQWCLIKVMQWIDWDRWNTGNILKRLWNIWKLQKTGKIGKRIRLWNSDFSILIHKFSNATSYRKLQYVRYTFSVLCQVGTQTAVDELCRPWLGCLRPSQAMRCCLVVCCSNSFRRLQNSPYIAVVFFWLFWTLL